ncbi:MAG: hypothetical protein ABIR70_07525 [Bryobacteraceae bacterium]
MRGTDENATGAEVYWKAAGGQWLGPEVGRCYLIALVDKATGRAQARFAPMNSAEENLRVLRQYVEQWGCPRSVHTNCGTLFRGNPISSNARSVGRGNSRIQDALRALQVEWIGEHKLFTTERLQRFLTVSDRLEQVFSKAQTKNADAANRYLQKKHLPQWNKGLAIHGANNAHRAPPADLESVFSEVTVRILQPGGILHYRGKHYSPLCSAGVALAPGIAIRIEERLDGTTKATADGRPVRLGAGSFASTPAKVPAIPKNKVDRRRNGRPKNREWMADFLSRHQRPLWMALRPDPTGDGIEP